MNKEKGGSSNAKLLGLTLVFVTSILIILLSMQIILHMLVLIYPAYMSVKVSYTLYKERLSLKYR